MNKVYGSGSVYQRTRISKKTGEACRSTRWSFTYHDRKMGKKIRKGGFFTREEAELALKEGMATHKAAREAKGTVFTLTGHQIQILRGPLVYLWSRNSEALYVGMSSQGLLRPLDPRHHRLQSILIGDSLQIIRCIDSEGARALEANLIEQLKPLLNGKRRLREGGTGTSPGP